MECVYNLMEWVEIPYEMSRNFMEWLGTNVPSNFLKSVWA